MKLVIMLGKLIKEFFSYVCVLMEMFIDKEMLEVISFENEWEVICYIVLKYKWK